MLFCYRILKQNQVIIHEELIYLVFSGRRKKLGEISARYKLSSLSPHVNWNIQRHIPWVALTTSSNYYSYGKNNTSAIVNVSEGGAISLPHGHGWPLEKVWESFSS